ncbi:ubiquitin-like-specific protease 1C isoform X2 [Eutrema salsugineum]|uniref:ubiquitin-like-specific protease 1C isoform X2 n=1 Tax=Eutrema salsugineum TaxID=72664 RepID=UPI000CED7AED|nr:ubiquitin-like-specific protease 1C isoform X2 [Eutrema salsugineum]
MKRQKVIELDCVETKGFNIDWENVLVDEEVPELEIIGSADKTPPRETTLSGDDSGVCVQSLSDSELEDHLKRQRSLLSAFSEKLPDKGNRIRTRIGNIEYEKQRRMLRRTKTDADRCQILAHSKSSDVFRQAKTASKDNSRQEYTGSKDVSRSIPAAHFSEKPKMDAQPVKLFDEELQYLGRESWKSKAGRETTPKQSNGWRSLPRLGKCQIIENNFYSGLKDPKGNRKPNKASVERKPKESSPYLLVDDDDDDDDDNTVIGYENPREWSLKASPSHRSSCRKKSDNKVINLDEDEPQSPTVEEVLELPEGLPEDICYPSRDDPDFVQVSLKDFQCLSPREYLTSPVINFYIRFLQHHVFSANQTAADSHFFNTFFYKKLIEAVSYKGNDKDAFFVKLRRWWKGFDIFRKSYIFIPIHEDLHWSLVIICIPDKEDESGLTLLHLDSLGLHPRKVIFNNVKRFLREEWNYLNQDASLSDLPISEKIWRDLPDRINEAQVQVPQQKNDFDCGLFVLFFIKQFIEDAPQRLKLHDLGMIHKKWFKPDEASALRIKIWNKLIELFRESNQTN